MATAGYSGTPLLKKMGIKPGMKILVMHPPENYEQLLNWPIDRQFSARGGDSRPYSSFCKRYELLFIRYEKNIALMQKK